MKRFQADLRDEINTLLERAFNHFNTIDFITDDPVQIPHRFRDREDIEIAGLLTALMSWGSRKAIIEKASELMQRLDQSPGEFVKDTNPAKYQALKGFVYRTFQEADIHFILEGLNHIYLHCQNPERVFHPLEGETDMSGGIMRFRNAMLSVPHLQRSEKHLASPFAGSAAKRINMFLRWMVRKDPSGVDFGLWEIPPSLLVCPLDVHSGRTARKLGLLTRKANDWKAAMELTVKLRELDPEDPVKYDFALFGLSRYPFA